MNKTLKMQFDSIAHHYDGMFVQFPVAKDHRRVVPETALRMIQHLIQHGQKLTGDEAVLANACIAFVCQNAKKISNGSQSNDANSSEDEMLRKAKKYLEDCKKQNLNYTERAYFLNVLKTAACFIAVMAAAFSTVAVMYLAAQYAIQQLP